MTTQDSTTVQNVSAAIDHFADKLRIPASQLWRTLQVQARIEFWQSLIWLVIALGVVWALVAGWRWASRAVDKENEGRQPGYSRGSLGDHPEWLMPLIIASIGTVILVVITTSQAINALGYYLNPDFYALKQIAKVFK